MFSGKNVRGLIQHSAIRIESITGQQNPVLYRLVTTMIVQKTQPQTPTSEILTLKHEQHSQDTAGYSFVINRARFHSLGFTACGSANDEYKTLNPKP